MYMFDSANSAGYQFGENPCIPEEDCELIETTDQSLSSNHIFEKGEAEESDILHRDNIEAAQSSFGIGRADPTDASQNKDLNQ